MECIKPNAIETDLDDHITELMATPPVVQVLSRQTESVLMPVFMHYCGVEKSTVAKSDGTTMDLKEFLALLEEVPLPAPRSPGTCTVLWVGWLADRPPPADRLLQGGMIDSKLTNREAKQLFVRVNMDDDMSASLLEQSPPPPKPASPKAGGGIRAEPEVVNSASELNFEEFVSAAPRPHTTHTHTPMVCTGVLPCSLLHGFDLPGVFRNPRRRPAGGDDDPGGLGAARRHGGGQGWCGGGFGRGFVQSDDRDLHCRGGRPDYQGTPRRQGLHRLS